MASKPARDIPRDLPLGGLRRGPDPAPPSPQRDAALALVPSTGWLLTAGFGDERAGLPVRWVQRAGSEPALVSVALRKGHPIAPLIRDSRAFALNLLPDAQPLLERRFVNGMAERLGDPFETLPLERMATSAPCLRAATAIIDCELFRHLDLEMECEMYVGLVLAARGSR